MKKSILFVIFLICGCSTSSGDFYTNAVGYYTLNSDGSLFIKMALGYDIASGTSLQFRGDGSLCTYGGDSDVLIASLISIKNGDQALFKLQSTNEGSTAYYAAMGNYSTTWISTTNLVTSENKVRYDSFIPIAVEN